MGEGVHAQCCFSLCCLSSRSPEPLVSRAPLPAIMCNSVSIGLWLPFLPPIPFPLLVTGPLPTLSGTQKRLSLRYSIFCPVPHFLTVLRHDPSATGNGHLQQSVLSLFPSHSHMIYAPPTPFKRTHLEEVTDHFKHFECGEVITLPRWSPPAPLLLLTAHCSSLSGPFFHYHYSSHSGSHQSARHVSPGLASLLLQPCNSHPIS